MTKPWLRLYRDALHKPKVGRLPLEGVGFWAACLMASDDNGVLPSVEDMMWTLRLHEAAIKERFAELERNGLVTRYVTEGVTKRRLHDWDTHQRKSDHDDSGAERQRQWRERQKAEISANPVIVTDSNALRNAPVTLPDTDTEYKKEVPLRGVTAVAATEPLPLMTTASKSQRRSMPWPEDAVIPFDWIEAAMAARARMGKGEIDYSAEAERFTNHFVASGKPMKDWRRAWLNWATSQYVDNLRGNGNGTGQKPTRAGSTFTAILTELADNVQKVRPE